MDNQIAPPQSLTAKPMDSIPSLRQTGQILREAIERSRKLGCLGPYVYGVGQALQACGIDVDRVNLPASRPFGFRHPIYSFANLTWQRSSGVQVKYMAHEQLDLTPDALNKSLENSPYYKLVIDREDTVRVNLLEDDYQSDLLRDLHTEGYQDYLALALCLPSDTIQPLSIASRTKLPDDIHERLALLQPLLSSTLDSLYQGSAAAHLAQSYIGRITGPKVLAGDFTRGNTQAIQAGILFCDIRGFTALTEKLGASGIVPIVNQIFDVVGQSVTKFGGEILKFIGDAMLLVFPVEAAAEEPQVAQAMISAVQEAVMGVETLAQKLEQPLAIGFGGHIGEVLYGNIGTEQRLDFTVMGPAVNLASRLESLCKQFETSAVFSDNLGQRCDQLESLGKELVKGIEAPVPVWGIAKST